MHYHSRTRISRSHPEASAVCDRCGFRFARAALKWQYDWAGPSLVNKQWAVCQQCLDEPSNAYRTILIPPDPVPVRDPRPVFWATQEPNFIFAENGFYLMTQDGNFLVTENSANSSNWVQITSESGIILTDDGGNILICQAANIPTGP